MVASRATDKPHDRVAELLDLNAGGIGVSTGYMRSHRGDWPALLCDARRVSRYSVELSALSVDELPGLSAFLANHASGLPFDYVAVHGPAKGRLGDPRQLTARLAALPELVSSVIMHPDTVRDMTAFTGLGERLLLENMNTQKRTGRTADELAPYFQELPHARFCFDIAHAYQFDPTLALAHELLDVYGDRLGQVHVSSIQHDGTHVPLSGRDAVLFSPVLERCVGIPWILEAAVPESALREPLAKLTRGT